MKKVKFRFPTIRENAESASIYEDTLRAMRELGIITKAQMVSRLRQAGIFTSEMQTQLDNIEGGDIFKYPPIKSFESKDEDNRFIEKCLVEIISGERSLTITQLNEPSESFKEYDEYRRLSSIKASYMQYTAEGLAEKKRLDYLISRCTFNADTDKPLWDNIENFYNFDKSLFISILSGKFLEFIGGFNQTLVRKISRHPIWRTKWLSATKLGSPIFSGNVSEWDVNKTYLCYWSNFLDNVYSSMEPPEDFIVKNDKLIDGWLEAKHRESKSGNRIDSSPGTDTTRAIFRPNINPIKKN